MKDTGLYAQTWKCSTLSNRDNRHLTILFFVLVSPVWTSSDLCSWIDAFRLNGS